MIRVPFFLLFGFDKKRAKGYYSGTLNKNSGFRKKQDNVQNLKRDHY